MQGFTEFPWATFCTVALAFLVAVVGGAVVVFGDPGALSFESYTDTLSKFAIGVGLLGVGRGVRSGLIKQKSARGQ